MKNKILLVDDESQILDVYEQILTKEDTSIEGLDFLDDDFGFENMLDSDTSDPGLEYQLYRANNGKEGVALAKENPDIKVAFIDMRMPPGINGAETARLIREINPRIEIVIVTAYSDINTSEIVNVIGSPQNILYLKKPFSYEEIEQLALNLVSKYNSETAKERLLSSMSHEMKTPLSVILGYTQVIQDAVPAEYQEFLQNIISSSQQLDGLVDDMLMRLEQTQAPQNQEHKDVKLSDIIEDVKKYIFIQQQKYPEISFETNIRCEDVNLKGNQSRLIHGLNNLIDNAFKFTKKGKIELTLSVKDNWLSINLSDEGIGISNENIEHVFDDFYRVENLVHTESGFGVGLTNAKDIFEAHHGKINIESELGKGTEVKVHLPL